MQEYGEKNGKVLSWASIVEDKTIEQALMTARMPFVKSHVALMPDAHVGFGSTVGSVIATKGAIMPAAVGVDIGCGMIAVETSLLAKDLPDDLGPLHGKIRKAVPAGVGQGHLEPNLVSVDRYFPTTGERPVMDKKLYDRAWTQFGSLGAGNHFVEICLDERDVVWVVLHSGSRGVGNELAKVHIAGAQKLMERYFVTGLEDRDLAYFVEDTPEFDAYITAMLWAQRYAMGNREAMMDAVLRALESVMPQITNKFGIHEVSIEKQRINCHHNYTERENHMGENVWLTRKGAIRARTGDKGVIPGSMGTRSYIVSGLGNVPSFHSCSHGAGRVLGRKQAERTLSVESLRASMEGKVWNDRDADKLVDEHPLAYKDIDQVMEDQKDLVTIEHTLHQILNYKGTK